MRGLIFVQWAVTCNWLGLDVDVDVDFLTWTFFKKGHEYWPPGGTFCTP